MKKDQKYLVLDYETYSEADLRKVGGWEYSVHQSTELLCAAWTVGTKEELRRGTKVGTWQIGDYETSLMDLKVLLNDPKYVNVAHNAFFEQVITKNVLGLKNIPPSQWICTATLAAVLALPRKLENICEVLKLPAKKDMEGHKLMLKMSKPKKPSKKDLSTRHLNDDDLDRLTEYCAADVKAEAMLLCTLPALSPFERKVWLHDQRMNLRGFPVDRKFIESTLIHVEKEVKRLIRRVPMLTGEMVESPNQQKKMVAFLNSRGVMINNLRADTLKDILDSNLVEDEDALEVIKIRQLASKTSTAKYKAIELRTRSDARLRDYNLYHGASTGRDTAMGFQPQNLPRGKLKEYSMDDACRHVTEFGLEGLRMLYEDPMELFSSTIRGCLIPPEGHTLFVADWNAIEVRVLFWLSKHRTGMDAYRTGTDLYVKMAAAIYGKREEDVTSAERFIGKTIILGCGYGLGWQKLVDSLSKVGVLVDEPFAKKAIKAYRDLHFPVPALWQAYGDAALSAVRRKGQVFEAGRCKFFVKGNFLYVQLPSGRKLAYFKPYIEMAIPPWAKFADNLQDIEKIPQLYFWGLDKTKRKLVPESTWGGKLTENISQAVARDIMVDRRLAAEEKGYAVGLTVHDEVLTWNKTGVGSVKEFTSILESRTPWQGNLPLRVEGFEAKRYRK